MADVDVYVGSEATALIVKAILLTLGVHLFLAVFLPSYYVLLTEREFEMISNFVNALSSFLRNFFSSLFGFL
jgi:hypothetical protein